MDTVAERIAELQRQRAAVVDAIHRSQQVLEKIDFALSFMLTGTSAASVSITPEGHIRDLDEHIIRILTKNGKVMTASAIAMDLYDPSMPMTFAQLKRRLSVKTSAMYKTKGDAPTLLDSGLKNKEREIYWALPLWMLAGKLDLTRVPDNVL